MLPWNSRRVDLDSGDQIALALQPSGEKERVSQALDCITQQNSMYVCMHVSIGVGRNVPFCL
jgi:hypothetical protein